MRKNKGGRPKKIVTCPWCRKMMGTAQFRAHFMRCARKQELKKQPREIAAA